MNDVSLAAAVNDVSLAAAVFYLKEEKVKAQGTEGLGEEEDSAHLAEVAEALTAELLQGQNQSTHCKLKHS